MDAERAVERWRAVELGLLLVERDTKITQNFRPKCCRHGNWEASETEVAVGLGLAQVLPAAGHGVAAGPESAGHPIRESRWRKSD